MGSDWTYERIEQLAPDQRSIRAARELVFVSRWATVGRLHGLVFGALRGKRSQYRVTIDTERPEYGCTCPSRKRPCKHVIALLLLRLERPHDVSERAPPVWVEDWIAERVAREERRAARAAGRANADPEAQKKSEAAAAKRADDREANVQRGIEDLARFLRDIVRQGIAAQAEHSHRHWDEMAKRMVDAQAPGLAKMLRTLGEIPHTQEGWPSRFLDRLARTHLLVEAYRRQGELDPEVVADVRAIVGHRTRQDDVRVGPSVEDQWWVLGARVEVTDEDMWTRRTWLFGERSKREALVLDFAFGEMPVSTFVPGTNVFASLAFYPGSWPVRAVVVQPPEIVTRNIEDIGDVADTIRANLDRGGLVLSRQPWARRFCARVKDVFPMRAEDHWVLRDAQSEVRVSDELRDVWTLLAVSGGRAVNVFGEWQGASLLPHGVVGGGTYVALDELERIQERTP